MIGGKWLGIAVVIAAAEGVIGSTSRADAPEAGRVGDARVETQAAAVNWLVKGGTFAQQHFSELRQINDANVAQLGFAWAADIPTPDGLAAEPIVVGGVIYLSTPPLSQVYAVDARTGRVIWRFDPDVRLDGGIGGSYAARVNRGVAVWKGKVYVGTADCRLFAIDAARGTRLWDAQVCNPRQTGITDAPRVANGKVFIGYNGSEDQVRGSVVALDARTGKEIWRFWTVPGNPAEGFESKALEMAAKTWSGKEWWWEGGGAVWSSITFDAKTNLLLFGTSTAHGLDNGQGPPAAQGAKLFSGCIVAVNADTGKYEWHYQTSTPTRQTENFHIALADLTMDGRQRHVAMTLPRNGVFYVLDARTGELISQNPVIAQGVGRTPYPGESSKHTEGCPGCWGVHNWFPMSYDPRSSLIYLPVVDRRDAPPDGERSGYFGKLVAWDVVRKTIRWAVDHPVAVNSGVLSTAGNLVFQGEGNGVFAAYAADSGKMLWSLRTGSAIDSVPVTYSVDGEQYVLVPVGWGSGLRFFGRASMMVTQETKYGPTRLLAFKLHSDTAFPSPQVKVVPVPRPPPQIGDQKSVARGKELASQHLCTGCHSPELDGSGAWTVDGGVPDLRYMPSEAHAEWYAIVLGGSHRKQGMMDFGVQQPYRKDVPLTQSEAADIHAYVISQAWKAYNRQQSSGTNAADAH